MKQFYQKFMEGKFSNFWSHKAFTDKKWGSCNHVNLWFWDGLQWNDLWLFCLEQQQKQQLASLPQVYSLTI